MLFAVDVGWRGSQLDRRPLEPAFLVQTFSPARSLEGWVGLGWVGSASAFRSPARTGDRALGRFDEAWVVV